MANRRPLILTILGVLAVALVLAGFAHRAGLLALPAVEVPAVGFGGGGQPEADVRPRSVSFEDVSPGEATTRTVRIRNDGTAPLTVENVTVAGDGGFEVVEPPPETIPAGETESFEVAFTPSTTRPTAATLVVATDDPDERRIPVYLSNTGVNVTFDVAREDGRTRVSAEVRNAAAGEPVSLVVPRTAVVDGADVQLASLSVTPEQPGAFALNATASADPLSSTPRENVSGAVEQLGYVSARATIDDDEIAKATFTYRVNKSRLERLQSEPPDVGLYRYERGRWREKPTTLSDETGGYYVFRTHSGGLSEWTTAAEVPRINVTDATVNVTTTTVQGNVDIDVLLTNTGGSDGLFVTKLLINDSVVERREVVVAPNASSLVTFVRSMDQPGNYVVEVNGQYVTTVTVKPKSTPAGDGDGDSALPASPVVALGVVLLVALVAAGGWYLRRSRGERTARDEGDRRPDHGKGDRRDRTAGDAERESARRDVDRPDDSGRDERDSADDVENASAEPTGDRPAESREDEPTSHDGKDDGER